MRRNCNLELRLVTSTDSDHHHHHPMIGESNENPQQQEQPGIFFNRRLFGYDAAELQARAILLLANQKIEEKLRSEPGSDPASPSLVSQQLYSPTGGLSMKRSLQRFLQKRNHRIQATSPYNIKDEARTCRFWKL